MYEYGASVNVVSWQGASLQVAVQRAHFLLRQCISRFHCCLARHRGSQKFVARMHTWNAIASEGIQRFPQAPLGIETGMGPRNCTHDEGIAPEALDLETQLLEEPAVRFERICLRRAEVQRERQQQLLTGCLSALQLPHESLVQ